MISPVTDLNGSRQVCDPPMESIAGANDVRRQAGIVVNEMMRNLDSTGFNDRASSLRVESGYWIFCSDSEFCGDCRTFGPGDYASLPGMNNVISSGRQISSDYPYDNKPNWQRDSFRQSQFNPTRQ